MAGQAFTRLTKHPMFPEMAKFAVVGGTAFSSDVILFNILRTGTDLGPLTAKALSLSLSIVVGFIGNRYWTYRERAGGGSASNISVQGLAFVVVTVLGMAIQMAFLGFSHYVLGLTSLLADNISGNIIGMGVATVFRFWGYRTWVFRHRAGGSAEAVPDEEAVPAGGIPAQGGSAEGVADGAVRGGTGS